MPTFAFGTGTAWYKEDGEGPFNHELKNMLKNALDSGVRHIDAAEAYGTEQEVGVAIKESEEPRNQLFVTTKVQQGIKNVHEALERSLSKLQLDYVDLYMIHWPYFTDKDAELQHAWAAMESVHEQGKAKAIGVCNYLRPHLEATLATANVKPMVNQIEHHPYLQRAHGYVPWMQSQNIRVEAFSPLTPITEASDGPLTAELKSLAAKYHVTATAILLRWQTQLKVTAVTTTANKDHLEEYLQAQAFEMSEDEMKSVTDTGLRYHYRSWGVKRFAPDDRT
ncbi:MAG: hypothetical protein M1828_007382 [Chrysothrix sp. TS-e1954]|nr:MAG: hypothetical protein M1828_007382 [Chrysothrix sp. TS-e1954]